MSAPTFAKHKWNHVLINTEGGHKKFWLARQEGDEYVACWGRLGTNGQTRRIKGDSWGKARKKESDGYEPIALSSLVRDYYNASMPSAKEEPEKASEEQIPEKKPRKKRAKKLGGLPQAKNWDW